MNTEEFAQGARCGHLEGKNRAGQYVTGEEVTLSWEAADARNISKYGGVTASSHAWAEGYQHGYLLAAEGSELDNLEFSE